MLSLGHFSSKKFLAAFAMAVFTLLPGRAAHADQFSYVFSGTAAGTFDGSPYGNTAFTVSFLEDTSTIDNRGGGYYSYDDVDATLVANSLTYTLTGVTLEVNGTSGFQNVDFYDSSFTNGLGISMVTPVGYNLTTNLNVPVTTLDLTPTFGGGTFSTTGDDTLMLTEDANLGFTATDLTPSAAPEPSSLLLLTTGLPGLALLRRRFGKA